MNSKREWREKSEKVGGFKKSLAKIELGKYILPPNKNIYLQT